jgi:hypothetical protein
MKVNKIAILMGVAGLVYGTSSNAFYNVDASLTAPTDYDFGFTYSTLINRQVLRTKDNVLESHLAFARAVDGVYYNYTWSGSTPTYFTSDAPSTIIPDGLIIDMTFNRSNTGWSFISPYYWSNENKIGSTSAVGTIANKIKLVFDNQTSKNYRLFLDVSSTAAATYWEYLFDTHLFYGEFGGLRVSESAQNFLYIPAFTKVEIRTISTSGARYFDAWYLKDLGVSDSWTDGFDEGYDDGENAIIASGGLQGIIEGVFEGIVAIFGIEIFNGVSLGAVALFPLVITLFVFVMKIVKMGG